ncbi:MAG: magnesium transporter CorA family protein [Micrococcales bacterium]
MQRSRIYEAGQVISSDLTIDGLDQIKKNSKQYAWLDLVNPSEEELNHLASHLELHELAVADALKGRQRPKLEHYDSHMFLNTYTAQFDSENEEIETYEISAFVTKQFLITVRDDEKFDINTLTKRWDDSFELAEAGVAFLLWGLLDVVVDSYFDVVETLDGEVEVLEDIMFSDKRDNELIQRRSYELRKALVTMRRTALPMREVINPLVKHDAPLLSNDMFPYFQDVYDHVMRVADWTDTQRDLVTTLLETNLTIQGNQMNLIMKKVTSWAAIIAVPTAITGWYGQNIPYPGFSEPLGYWSSLISIVVISGILWGVFKKNDWL